MNAALGEINDEEIKAIENDMQRISQTQLNSNANLKSCFEKFDHNPEDFRFLAGDKAILRMLASTVKKRGFNHYMKKKNCQVSQVTHLNPSINVVECAVAIRRRVLEFYQKR